MRNKLDVNGSTDPLVIFVETRCGPVVSLVAPAYEASDSSTWCFANSEAEIMSVYGLAVDPCAVKRCLIATLIAMGRDGCVSAASLVTVFGIDELVLPLSDPFLVLATLACSKGLVVVCEESATLAL